jgi:hypothetical protein
LSYIEKEASIYAKTSAKIAANSVLYDLSKKGKEFDKDFVVVFLGEFEKEFNDLLSNYKGQVSLANANYVFRLEGNKLHGDSTIGVVLKSSNGKVTYFSDPSFIVNIPVDEKYLNEKFITASDFYGQCKIDPTCSLDGFSFNGDKVLFSIPFDLWISDGVRFSKETIEIKFGIN